MSWPAPLARWLKGRPEALLYSWRLSLELTLGRRLVHLAVVDAFLLLAQLLGVLAEGRGGAGIYSGVVLMPLLLLGVPALAGMVALERQAGSLDLALATPSVEGYFLRRAAAVVAVMVAQSLLLLLPLWLLGRSVFPLWTVLLQVLAVNALLAAVVLFWAVRLRTAGAVWGASIVTLLLLGPWLFYNPVPADPAWSEGGWYLPSAEESVDWLLSFSVLAAAAVLFFLYARRRLRRPETLLH